MKKKFLSNAPPAMSHAPPGLHTAMNAIDLGTTHTASVSDHTLHDTTGETHPATG